MLSLSVQPSSIRAMSNTRGRPAKHYRRGWADTLHPPLLRPRDRLKETESWYENVSLKSLMSEE
jgi:hypothetical protein